MWRRREGDNVYSSRTKTMRAVERVALDKDT